MSSIYYSGKNGKNVVYQIISRLSQEVVGSTSVISEQAKLLQKAFYEGGMLNSLSNEFLINICFDEQGNKMGYELFSNSKGEALLSNYKGEKYLVDGTIDSVNKIPNAEYIIALNRSIVYLDESGNFLDVINSSGTSASKTIITKSGNRKISISRIGDILGEGIKQHKANIPRVYVIFCPYLLIRSIG